MADELRTQQNVETGVGLKPRTAEESDFIAQFGEGKAVEGDAQAVLRASDPQSAKTYSEKQPAIEDVVNSSEVAAPALDISSPANSLEQKVEIPSSPEPVITEAPSVPGLTVQEAAPAGQAAVNLPPDASVSATPEVKTPAAATTQNPFFLEPAPSVAAEPPVAANTIPTVAQAPSTVPSTAPEIAPVSAEPAGISTETAASLVAPVMEKRSFFQRIKGLFRGNPTTPVQGPVTTVEKTGGPVAETSSPVGPQPTTQQAPFS